MAKIELDDLEGDLREIGERIGIEAVRVLITEFGGAFYYIPLARKIRKYRRRLVEELYKQGKSIQKIATLVGCSVNTVRRDLQEMQNPRRI
jgi:DNA invertase Pin-like site-specific DNA recombinase